MRLFRGSRHSISIFHLLSLVDIATFDFFIALSKRHKSTTVQKFEHTMEKTKDSELDFTWTTGNMGGISHEALIALGGYGEVHKVLSSKS
jgi:hypothetical protein